MVFIDKEDALAIAIKVVFPEVRQLYCIWHINKCIQLKLSGIYPKKTHQAEQDKFWVDWKQVVAAKTPRDVESKWKELMKPPKRRLLKKYLELEWMGVKEQFCHAWTNNCLHIGQRATSRVESAHHALKRYIKVSTGDLKHVVDACERLMIKQIKEHRYQLEKSRLQHVKAHSIVLFEWVVDYVNPKALDLVLDHWVKLKEQIVPVHCSGVFIATMGLPCGHQCEEQQACSKPFMLKWFHFVWRYQQTKQIGEDVDKDYELIRNPAIIPRKRRQGSRAGLALSSTRRDLSHWEEPEPAPIRGRGRGRPRGRPCGRPRGGVQGIEGIDQGISRKRRRPMVDLSDDDSNDNDNDGNQSRECTPLSDHDKWVHYARRKASPTWKAKDAAEQAALEAADGD